MARPALPMSALAEEPASDTINILGCTSDYPLESYEPLAAAQESEAKAQLKILLSLATNLVPLWKVTPSYLRILAWMDPKALLRRCA